MDAALEFLSSFLPYIMRFNLYSWLFLAGALVLFVLIFVLGMMVHGAARKILIICACMIPTDAPFLLEFASKKMLMPVDVNLRSTPPGALSPSPSTTCPFLRRSTI